MTPRRILMVSPTATHPQNAGNRARVFAICEALQRLGHDLHLAYLQRDSPGDAQAMQAYFGQRLHRLPYAQPARRENPLQALSRRARSLLSVDARYAFGIDDWYDDAIDAPLAALHERHAFDVVIVEYVFLSRAFELFGASTTKILDTHDIFTQRHRLFLDRKLSPEWFSTSAAEEARGLARADTVIAIQAGERGHFEALGARRVIEVGHIVNARRCFPNRTRQPAADMLFVGGASPINADAVTSFAQHALPLIRRRIPNARLLVAGAVCDRIAPLDACVALGRVDDLMATYADADLVINPVRLGTGLNIKSVEALSYGMPLLASTTGARGLEHAAGQALLVADTPIAFAEAACRVLLDDALRERLSDEAWAYINDSNARHLSTLNAAVSG